MILVPIVLHYKVSTFEYEFCYIESHLRKPEKLENRKNRKTGKTGNRKPETGNGKHFNNMFYNIHFNNFLKCEKIVEIRKKSGEIRNPDTKSGQNYGNIFWDTFRIYSCKN